MPAVISVLSTEQDRWAVTSDVDPTALDVSVAYMLSASDPTESDWHTAAWEAETIGGAYIATIDVGPDGVDLATGTYLVWLRIGDIVEPAGNMLVY